MSNELSILELEAERAEVLPAREALATLNLNIFKTNMAGVTAQNSSLALNFGGAHSAAVAGSTQLIGINQS
jgi:hypothetical protein